MDVNLFELAGKTTRRIVEGIEDAFMASEEVITTNILQGLIGGRGATARQHQAEIISQARQSLQNGDLPEAIHQLERDLYFSSIMPTIMNSPQRKEAQAGLEAIKAGVSPKMVGYIMTNAFFEAISSKVKASQELQSTGYEDAMPKLEK